MLARFFAWTAFAAAFLFIGSLTVLGQPGVLAMSPSALWQGCAPSQRCPGEAGATPHLASVPAKVAASR